MPSSPLSDTGEHQARLLAARLAELPVARVLCSDYRRAHHTAETVHHALQSDAVPLLINTGLRERNFGELRGQRYDDVSPSLFAEAFSPPNGETWAQFDTRIADTWRAIISNVDPEEKGHTLVITHGLVCRSVVRQFGQTEHAVPDLWHNTSVTVLAAAAPHRVTLLNDASHLTSVEGGAQV